MVNAIFSKKNNNIVSLKVEGHAGSVSEGYDMVCTAISAISIAIANGITEVLKVKPEIKEQDGFLNINLTSCKNEEVEKCQVLMETMLLGLRSIEYNYGKYIKILVEEV